MLLVILTVAYGILWFLKWKDLPPQIPLFYSLPRSEEQLTKPEALLFLPLSSLFVFLTHTTIAAFLYSNHKLAAQLLFAICAIVWIVLFITFVNILFLVT